MGEIRDFFIKSLDEAECGINGMMCKLGEQLKSKDSAVWFRLHDQELYPQYYSFRWLTLLLSQEFPLPDVLRIWDSLFADEKRFEFLIYICCSMIMLTWRSRGKVLDFCAGGLGFNPRSQHRFI
uniref:Rab-GAP TBC domain-containing protein n=1 Tax=Timema poppense TaxID=170557 RepID=A0A7R9DVM3_TIMPO|nr:unnamed protein product [Timema poppensis]